MFAIGDRKLGATLETRVGLDPRRLLVEHVEQLEHELFGGHRMVEDGRALVVVCANRCAVLDQAATQRAVAVLIGVQQCFTQQVTPKLNDNETHTDI